MNGADLFVRALTDRGVEFVTTVSGNGTEPFYAACRRANLRLVDFRNEQAAAFAAERTSDALRYAGDTARDRASRFADEVVSVSERASPGLRAAMPDRDDRDNLLLGAAAVAVAAAVGLAVQRRAHDNERF